MLGSLYGIAGRTSLPVEVSLTREEARARAGEVDVAFPFATSSLSRGGIDGHMLVLETARAGVALTLFIPLDQAVLGLPADAPAVVREAVLSLAGERSREGRRGVLLICALVAGSLALACGAWSLLGMALARAVDAIPATWEASLGEAAVASIRASAPAVTDPRITGPVREITRRLAAQVESSPYRFTVHVLEKPEVNAMALPGGEIVVLTGLLAAADDPDQVAGVLGHEIQHVVLRHGLEAMMQSLKWRLALSLVVGDADSVREQLVRQAGAFAELSHSREAERAADREGVRLVHRAGFDPEGMARFFEKLSRTAGGAVIDRLAFLTTHPGQSERVANARALGQELGPVKAVPLAVDWPAFKQALK